MKRIRFWIVTLFILTSFIPIHSIAGTVSRNAPIASNKESGSEAANVLLKRLFEINAMDKSELNLSEKQELRKEVRSIRDDLKKLDGGIYLSVGAIIIILLILILLL